MSNRLHVRKKAVALLDASDSRVLTPALDFGNAVRDLTDAQAVALLALLATFEAHPRYSTPERYLTATTERYAR